MRISNKESAVFPFIVDASRSFPSWFSFVFERKWADPSLSLLEFRSFSNEDERMRPVPFLIFTHFQANMSGSIVWRGVWKFAPGVFWLSHQRHQVAHMDHITYDTSKFWCFFTDTSDVFQACVKHASSIRQACVKWYKQEPKQNVNLNQIPREWSPKWCRKAGAPVVFDHVSSAIGADFSHILWL